MFAALGRFKIIPILKIKEIETDDALHVAEALFKGGLPVMEMTFRRHSDSKAIREIAREFPDFLIGAGGILNRDQLLRAFDCKAKFATSPGVNPDTIKTAAKKKIAFAPGASTATDIENILINGVVDFQFFPAEASGGVDYLESILEPFEHLPIDIFPKGGISTQNAKDYLELPQVCAVTVEDIIYNDDIENGNWDRITENARRAVAQVHELP
ncbi:bifunctional 4-hydroxy-2-oxoglutarate aldolase/2-dehydro-3-deoxy-phosphogluconate aldolase [Lentisphaerota bacterium ZTH]|nr:bifunctional 4-hydroxy-2-oxoglutarate aldolase/2-dehydro-3-deoxy-phosphogluconate aldolase [Lentisphaerota bacterium]WET05303.1 bifunctional 4-hydroxy-2-oxoglutarate aldolase/2-dehydro-3-deoxy-phosphogluconate aldolase [Lentisphaerota bacterium ZTH]